MTKQLFITGTDTDIGKTFVTAILAKIASSLDLTNIVMKPIQTGIEQYEEDLDTVYKFAPQTIKLSNEIISPYRLKLPASPHFAAEKESVMINVKTILEAKEQALSLNPDLLLIEGAGGVMVPIVKNYLMIDLISEMKIPAIVVTSTKLGTINHTLLTIDKLQKSNIPIAAVIFTGLSSSPTEIELNSIETIKKLSNINNIYSVPFIENLKEANIVTTIPEYENFKNLITT
jgi:dethiobiotin synthetase